MRERERVTRKIECVLYPPFGLTESVYIMGFGPINIYNCGAGALDWIGSSVLMYSLLRKPEERRGKIEKEEEIESKLEE